MRWNCKLQSIKLWRNHHEKNHFTCYCALCWSSSFCRVVRTAASHLRKKAIRQIHRSVEINLDVQDREIEVSLSEDEQVHIQYSENSKEYYDISVSDENVLTMTSASNKEWTDYIGVKPSAENRKISLQIPNALLENLTLSTTNEDITLSALAVTGSINISSNGGNITFENLRCRQRPVP